MSALIISTCLFVLGLKHSMLYSQLFSGLGIATVSFLSIKLLRFVSLYKKPSSSKPYLHGDSPWAFVTGASDGIGRGFAQELDLPKLVLTSSSIDEIPLS